MAKEAKRKWVRPILIVLVRWEDRQERILVACKTGGLSGQERGPQLQYRECDSDMNPCGALCSSLSPT